MGVARNVISGRGSFMSHAHLSHYKYTLSYAHLLVSAVCSTKLRVSMLAQD